MKFSGKDTQVDQPGVVEVGNVYRTGKAGGTEAGSRHQVCVAVIKDQGVRPEYCILLGINVDGEITTCQKSHLENMTKRPIVGLCPDLKTMTLDVKYFGNV